MSNFTNLINFYPTLFQLYVNFINTNLSNLFDTKNQTFIKEILIASLSMKSIDFEVQIASLINR